MRHNAVTKMLLPACEDVPTIMRLLLIDVPNGHSVPAEHCAAMTCSLQPLGTGDSTDSRLAQTNLWPAGHCNCRPSRAVDIAGSSRSQILPRRNPGARR